MQVALEKAEIGIRPVSRFAVVSVDVQIRNESPDSALGKNVEFFRFAIVRLEDVKEFHFEARFSEIRQWYLDLKGSGVVEDSRISVPFPPKLMIANGLRNVLSGGSSSGGTSSPSLRVVGTEETRKVCDDGSSGGDMINDYGVKLNEQVQLPLLPPLVERRRDDLCQWLEALLFAYPSLLKNVTANDFLTKKRCPSPVENETLASVNEITVNKLKTEIYQYNLQQAIKKVLGENKSRMNSSNSAPYSSDAINEFLNRPTKSEEGVSQNEFRRQSSGNEYGDMVSVSSFNIPNSPQPDPLAKKAISCGMTDDFDKSFHIVHAKSLAEMPLFNQEMEAFLIPFESLDLEKQAFAAGGGGKVFLGSYAGTPIAAKTLYSQQYGDERDEFDREFRTLATLHHPNIVTFFGMSRNAEMNALYNVVEFCGGGTLFDFMMSYHDMFRPGEKKHDNQYNNALSVLYSPKRYCDIVSGVLEGVRYMHANGFAHRDLKPQNVLLTLDGRIKLCDMGIVVRASQGRGRLRKLRSKGNEDDMESCVGTLPYMPPEAFDEFRGVSPTREISPVRGKNRSSSAPPPPSSGAALDDDNDPTLYDPRTWDVYSLGIMLWQLWYRVASPYENLGHHNIVRRVRKGLRPPQYHMKHSFSTAPHTPHHTHNGTTHADNTEAAYTQTPPPLGHSHFVTEALPPKELSVIFESMWVSNPVNRPKLDTVLTKYKSNAIPFLKKSHSANNEVSWADFGEVIRTPTDPAIEDKQMPGMVTSKPRHVLL